MRTLFAAIELCSDDRMIGDAFRQAKIYKVFQTMCPSEYTFVELSLCVHAYIITLHNARCVCVFVYVHVPIPSSVRVFIRLHVETVVCGPFIVRVVSRIA